MSLFENFPYTNLHQLNLNWLINQIKNLTENMVISVNGQTGEVVLYQNATVEFPAVTDNHWSIVRAADGTTRGIMFGNDNKAYILHGSYMNEVYAANNPPPYPVTSVNGQTGAITLYSDRVVRLPSLTDEEIHSWNIFRDMNNVSSGIEFDEAGDAYIIFGQQRYKLYSTKNAATIVTSVNGEHGEVDLFTDNNGEVAFPAFVDPLYDGWMIRRDVNDDRIGLLLKQDGTLSLIINDAVYTVYNSNDPQPDWVNDPTASMIQISAPANGAMWGFIRNTSIAPVGILFDNTQQNSPKAYVQYTDSNNVVQTVQLITMADIPQSSVISVNGQGGIVVLTDADINVSGSDTRKINTVLSSLETAKQVTRQAMAYNETSNVASTDIPSGSYVFWNNGAYVASQNISYGDTLSSSNLSPVVDQYNQPCGFANALNSKITKQDEFVELYKGYPASAETEYSLSEDYRNFRYVCIAVAWLGGYLSNWKLIPSPLFYCPGSTSPFRLYLNGNPSGEYAAISARNFGKITAMSTNSNVTLIIYGVERK